MQMIKGLKIRVTIKIEIIYCFIKYLTIFNIVTEVLGAEAGPDRGPGVLLGPGQGAGAHRGDWVIRMTQENTGRETLPIRACKCYLLSYPKDLYIPNLFQSLTSSKYRACKPPPRYKSSPAHHYLGQTLHNEGCPC